MALLSFGNTDCDSSKLSSGLSQQIYYALPTVPAYFLVGPLTVVSGIYAKHFGISLSTIAAVLLASRLFDAISDPIIGYCSDRYHAKTGTRKPFVVVGGLLLVISSYFLFSPTPNAISTQYFLLCFLAWYFAFSLFEIPQLSWGTELVIDSHTRTGLYGLRYLGVNIGQLMFYLVPLLPFFDTSAYTPHTLYWVVLIAGVLMLPSLWVCYRLTPNEHPLFKRPEKHTAHQSCVNPGPLVREIVNNKALLIFLGTFFLFGIGAGMHLSLQFILIDIYLGLGQHFAVVNMIGLGVGSLLIIVCIKLARHIDKKLILTFGLMMIILGIGFFGLLKPNETNIFLLAWVMVFIFSGISIFNLVVPSLLADIIDYSIWKHNSDNAGAYFSLLLFSIKTTGAVGGALGLGVAGWYGFDAAATSHTVEQVHGLLLAAFWLPIPILLLTLMSVVFIPVNSRRQRIVRRRLDARIARVRPVISQDEPIPTTLHKSSAVPN